MLWSCTIAVAETDSRGKRDIYERRPLLTSAFSAREEGGYPTTLMLVPVCVVLGGRKVLTALLMLLVSALFTAWVK
jgi:hypothetical protein